MSIKRKALSVIASLGLVFLVATLGVLHLAIFPAFEDLERELATENLTRVEQALEAQFEELRALNRDWTIWDETYQFMQDGNEEFRRINLHTSSMMAIRINALAFIGTDGQVVWRRAIDLDTQTSLPFDELLREPWSAESALVFHGSIDSSFAGILSTRSSPMMVVSYPILTGDREGPIQGALVMGRFLDSRGLGRIRQLTDVAFDLVEIDRDQLTDADRRVMERFPGSSETIFFDDQEQFLHSYRIINDVSGSPAFLLKIHTPHRVTNIGAAAIQAAIALLMVAIVFLNLFAWGFLNRSILNPVLRLKNHMVEMRGTGDLSRTIGIDRNDEIGQLGTELDKLTNELHVTRTELVDSRDAALAGSAAKSEFLATMSHEIRTPMNGVLGMTELLLSSGLDKRQRHLAQSAHRSADSLLSVINDILDFSKIEADKLDLDLQEFDLIEVCEDTVEMVAETAQRKGLEIVSDFAQDTPRLVGDPTRIRQVLLNLMSNAVKFTDAGEVRLGQRSVSRNDDTLELQFEVVDTGIGIEAQKLTTIFDPFTQADGSMNRSYGGTGLGLAISNRLVSIMNGELAVESEIGRGTCFRLNIALRIAAHQAPESVDSETLKGIRTLVVDDHGANREILQGQLVSWGMRTDTAKNGGEAIQLLEAAAIEGDPYRIGLFDWHMPEMDGIELASRVNAEPRIPDLPVMVLSSTFAAADSQISKGIVNRFLTKPVRRRELLNNLRAVLGGVERAASDSTDGQTQGRLRGRVLLAEDNEVNQEVACAALEVAGCEVTIVDNGIGAVKAVSANTFDLILMDCHMPEMDGFEATKRIRALEGEADRPRVPIIALTADVRKGIDEQCKQGGMDGYLSKPFGQDDLTSVLAEWLTEASNEASGSQSNVQLGELHHFDEAAVKQLWDLSRKRGKNILQRAMGLYEEQFPKLLAAARGALENDQLDECANVSHSLKSATANVGAANIAEICAEVERAARAGSDSGLDTMLDNIEAAYDEAQAELTILLSVDPDAEITPKAPADESLQRILIADDDPSIRLTLGETLMGAGYAVDECSDGAAVLRTAKRNPPDMILLDAIMPGMDGFETCQRLNEDPRLCHVPVMMITGLDDTASINRAFAAGATAFAPKPINLVLLLEDIRFILRTSIDAERLRDSQAQLEAAQRLARIGYWQWKAQTDVFECSEQIETIFGYDRGELGSDRLSFIDVVQTEDRDMVANGFAKAAESGEGGTLEYRVLTPAGHELLVRQETEVKYDGAGHCTVFGAVQDISMQRAAEDKIRKLAYYDPLTSLASRSYFMQRIDEATKAAKRRDEGLAVFFMDLDGFKDVNDTLGHDVGDRLLEEVARRLRKVFREMDFIARLGGDEFVVLMENLSDSFDIAQVAQRCLSEIEKPVDLDVRQLRPRMSIGIARFPEDGETAQMLIKAADSAMYSAKQAGKHRFEYYSTDLTEQAEKRLSLVSDLRDAFRNDEFILHYQPLVDIKTGRVEGVEALVRWQHPQRGMVPPLEFISQLERMGMINELGELVLEQACAQTVLWSRDIRPIKVSVNISPSHFHDASLIGRINTIIAETGIHPHQLVLEVTESAIQDHDDALTSFAEIRSLGVGLAIDDFGTGYSSLGSLHKIPMDILKIDRIFIRDLLVNPRDAIMLGTIMGMAHALELQVVAEGVEELGQVQALVSLGCDFVQGFYFSKPVPAADVPALLEKSYMPESEKDVLSYSNRKARR